MNTDEVETRLRAAYQQTAGLRWQQSEDAVLAAAELTPQVPRPARGRWLLPAVAATLLVAVLALTIEVGTHRGHRAGSAAPTRPGRAVSSNSGHSSASATVTTGPAVPLPAGGRPQLGVRYQFAWLIHCQMTYAQFGGQLWRTLDQVPGWATSRPLPGGSRQYTGYLTGAFELTSATTAVFTADPAAVQSPLMLRFVAAAPGTPPIPICA